MKAEGTGLHHLTWTAKSALVNTVKGHEMSGYNFSALGGKDE